jgi:hypothetical protein
MPQPKLIDGPQGPRISIIVAVYGLLVAIAVVCPGEAAAQREQTVGHQEQFVGARAEFRAHVGDGLRRISQGELAECHNVTNGKTFLDREGRAIKEVLFRCDLIARLSSLLAATATASDRFGKVRDRYMDATESAYFDLKTVALLRDTVEDAWVCLQPKQRENDKSEPARGTHSQGGRTG